MDLLRDGSQIFEVRGRLAEEAVRCLEMELEGVLYQEARVYSHVEGECVDLKRRSSSVHTGHDEKVFEIARGLLLPLLREAQQGSWTLLANHYDVVRYAKGDFFRKHVDFTPVVTAYSTHFVLLLCLHGDCTGGETRVWLSDGAVVSSSATTSRGDFLVFRGDLAHEGDPVLGGQKVVVRFDALFSPSLVQALPFFEMQRRFVSLGGLAGDGLSSEHMSLLDLYVHGGRIPDDEIAELHALLRYVGCPEASVLEAESFERFIREGFVVATAPTEKTGLWEAGLRKGMCSLLMVVGSRCEIMEWEESHRWNVTGAAVFFRDGTPALFSGFERCLKKVGFLVPDAVQKMPVSSRSRLRREIFNPRWMDPRSMERDAVIWVASTELQREHEDVLLDLGTRMEAVARDPGFSLMDDAKEEDYDAWSETVQPMISTVVAAAKSNPLLSSRDHWPFPEGDAFASSTTESVLEYCNCDGDDSNYSLMYSTVVYNEAWCLIRHPGTLATEKG